MTKNIIIIGSSGAIGSSFLKYYAEEDKNNAIYLHHEELNKKYGFFLKFTFAADCPKVRFAANHQLIIL